MVIMKKNTFKKILYSIILYSFLILFNTGCSSSRAVIRINDYALNTVVSITVYEKKDEEPGRNALSLIRNYDALFSKTDTKSDIYRLNQALSAPVIVDNEVSELIKIALTYCELTEGKIDISVAPLSSLWNFSENAALSDPSIPSDEEIKEALSHVDYHNIILNGDTVTLSDPKAGIDLGCIAKGYIADKVKEYLRLNGVQKAIINLGGNITLLGTSQKDSDFKIGIQKPFGAQGEYSYTVSAHDCTISTCGIYERCFEKDNRLYHHILDTKTGYPIESDILSVTCISENGAIADILSTAFMVMGPDETLTYLENHDEIRAIFILRDGSVIDSLNQ